MSVCIVRDTIDQTNLVFLVLDLRQSRAST